AQRFGALLWSGDIDSSFEAFRNQVNTGLNVGLAGIPWWTTDIGGFHGGNPEDPEFRELLIRWFQYATFSPILRMHGDRLPHSKPLSDHGGGSMVTGAPNEIWSYGIEVEQILTKYIKIREALKPYISTLMDKAHRFGDPIMRTLFYEYPSDNNTWAVEDTYLFGDTFLIAPIVNYKETVREVYLPINENWTNIWTGEEYDGGQTLDVEADISMIPVFIKTNQKDKFSKLLSIIKEEI
ncbi:glycoside hydrolase family 31 protein, partial [Enterococcus faecium]|nr:glycoside hydrolase family 31 protein [Enterococcus faecium]